MQGKIDSALCSKHNQPIQNVYLTEKGIVGQCQQCVTDQQKPLEKFLDDYQKLTENAQQKLQISLEERTQRCNFLTKIIKAFQEELSKYLEEIIKTIDSQLEKSKTEVHDTIASFHDKKNNFDDLSKIFSKLQDEEKSINYSKQSFHEDDMFKDGIYFKLCKITRQIQPWPELLNHQWRELYQKQKVCLDENMEGIQSIDQNSKFSQTSSSYYRIIRFQNRPNTAQKTLPPIPEELKRQELKKQEQKKILEENPFPLKEVMLT